MTKLSPLSIGLVALASAGLWACGGSSSPPKVENTGGSTGTTGGTGGVTTTGGSGGTTTPDEAGGSGGTGGSGGSPNQGTDAGAGGSAPDAGAVGGTGGSASGGTGGSVSGGHGGGASGGAGGLAVGGSGGVPATSGNFPARVTAPYVESWNDDSLASLATSTGHKFYTLAFVIARGNGCTPSWNGDTTITAASTTFVNDVAKLRQMGGDIIISFGGASGTELGDACTTVEALQAAYQTVITRYALKWIDLDVESGAESHTAAIDRRNKALANLKAANPGLRVSYTLGVDPSGLPSDQRNVVANAKTNSLAVDVVNVMAMDYGACNLDMGKAATDAATATHAQLQKLGVDFAVGVTPMTGTNDTACENFTTANAKTLVDFANANDWVKLLAFWSVDRDGNHDYLDLFGAFK
ncbi:MAG TPA: glycosyl hydrolase family 18 protein [Polyangia bacterium]|nr:glycosyl hydrolase family 18 protein [Polyangia bacterium]